MAQRSTTLKLKNSSIVSRPLPTSLNQGEAIVNTADGIVYFSGVTQSTSGWTSAGTGFTAGFFEAGSNLYDLAIRNRITKYEGISGAGLVGKFLSGTTNGFVLANISSIAGVDTYVTGGTPNNSSLNYLFTNNTGGTFTVAGLTDVRVTGGTYNNGTGVATFINNTGGTFTVAGFTSSSAITDTYVTGGTANNSSKLYTFTNNTGGTFNVTALTDIFLTAGTPNDSSKLYTFTNSTGGTFNVTALTDIRVTGGTYNNPTGTATFTNNTGGTFNVSGFITGTTTDTYVTGGTTNNSNKLYTFTNNSGGTFNVTGLTDIVVTGGTPNNSSLNYLFTNNTGGTFTVVGLTDVRVTGGTYSNPTGTATFTNNTGGTFTVAGFTTGGTAVTAYTYTAAQNKATISQSGGLTDLSIFITSMSGLTLSNLTPDRLVYTTTGGALITGTAIFDGTNMQLPAAGSLTVGTGGVTIGSGGSPSVAGTGDLVVNGNLTVFGAAISAFTAQLYVEDPNVIFNYNPTGSTIATSIGAGLTIQDGNGIVGGNVTFDVRAMNTFTGLTATQVPVITEYTGATGFSTRAWVTPLADIVLRSTVPSTPNGVRVLTEFDLLDGGSY